VSIVSEEHQGDQLADTIDSLNSLNNINVSDTLDVLASNSTVSTGLKQAILNYMPSLKWLFVFIDN